MLRSLRVQNFKCLADVTVELEPLTVLIGKNDTGKSSFLNAVEVLGRMTRGLGVGDRSLAGLVRNGSEPANVRWSASVVSNGDGRVPGDANYSLAVGDAGTFFPRVIAESAVLGGKAMTDAKASTFDDHLVVRDGTEQYSLVRRTGTTALSAARDDARLPTWRSLARALVSSPIYRLEPAQLAKPSELSDEVAVLAADGFGLATLLDGMLGTDREAFDVVEQKLRDSVPSIRRIKLVSWRHGDKSGKQLAFELASGGDIAAPLASEGVLLLLAYLALTHQPNPPRILLIEEPENGIHPRRLQEVAGYLRALSDPARPNAAQIIVATHSPYFLDFVPPEAVRVFGRGDDGATKVVRLDNLPHFKQRIDAGQTLGELWYNVGEDRILEGQVDEAVAGE